MQTPSQSQRRGSAGETLGTSKNASALSAGSNTSGSGAGKRTVRARRPRTTSSLLVGILVVGVAMVVLMGMRSVMTSDPLDALSAATMEEDTDVQVSPSASQEEAASEFSAEVEKPTEAEKLGRNEGKKKKQQPEMDARIGTVQSVAELRDFCRTHAPELQTASWMRNRRYALKSRSKYVTNSYAVYPAPVCTSREGKIYLDPDAPTSTPSHFEFEVTYRVYNLTDDIFQLDETHRGFATAVPALALMAKSRWIDSHIWHLIRDCLGALIDFFYNFKNREMLSLPTQAVLVRGVGTSWRDRYGDSMKRMELSARVLNSVSSPLKGGPFFNISPIVSVRKGAYKPPPDDTPVEERAKKPVLQCYCQALNLHRRIVIARVDPNVYYGLQDMTARQFGADKYQQPLTLAEIESRRLASHPWASQFWNTSSAFDEKGVYRPRALVIHRQSRLIGDIAKYVEHLKRLDFRVQEIYPEKYPLEQQYHMGRYADLIIGIHGLGIAHGFWMDRFPIGCRAIMEFKPWVTPGLPVDLRRVMGDHMKFDYYHIAPIDVKFGKGIRYPKRARERLMDPAKVHSAWSFREFTDQTAYYNETAVFADFDKIRRHLDECLPLGVKVPHPSPIYDISA